MDVGDGQRDEIDELRRRVAELEAEVRRGRDAEAFLHAVLETVPATVARTDADLLIRQVNRTHVGVRPDQVIGASATRFVPPETAHVARAVFENVLRTGQPARFSTPVPTGGAGPMPVYDCYASRIEAVDGAAPGLVFAAVDVTDQRKRDEALRQSEAWLRVALDATGMGLWAYDTGSGAVVWNEHMHAITGAAAPMTPYAYLDLVHPDDRAQVETGIRTSFATGTFESIPHRLVRPDGTVRWVITMGKVVTDPDGGAARAIGGTLDTTAQHQTDERIRQAQRMESLGQLAAGIAHNFNNMLAAIVPALELLRPVVPESRVGLVDDALHAALRAAEMVRQLMRFAGRRHARAARVERVGDVITLAASMCRPLFERHIALEAQDNAGRAYVRGEAGEVEQAIVNMLLNARDAVVASGRAAGLIRVEADQVDGGELPSAARQPGQPFVRIRVTDDGVGMPPEVRARVFEPFFTTKEPGRGTGLGLATVYTTVREHGGLITCESTPGVGTTFDVFLPCTELVPPGTAAGAARRAPQPVRGRGELVLLVDDEDTVRRATVVLLEGAGYKVAPVARPPEALAVLETRHDVAVVLLFHSTPDVRSVLREARRLAPAARILLVTGHGIDAASSDADAVLVKPTAAHELLGAIRDALERAPRASPP